MLEKLVAWVLNSYLGDYLELNTHQLSVGILSGQVELENIPLKRDAFDKFDLPLQVQTGCVGKISLSIPVAEMSSQPWVINISDVYIVVEPNSKTKFDEAEQKKKAGENKKNMLQELEDNWKLERQPEAPTSYYGSWLSYGTGIAGNIMENLQLNMSGLHIRYEGHSTHSTIGYSFGLVIEKLVAQSTDSSWTPQYVSRGVGGAIVHKLVELVGLSLYWDHNTQRLNTSAGLKEQLDSLTHNYLLEPVSGKALVQRNTSVQPLRSQSEPRVNVELQFDSFMLSLDDVQYGGIASLIRFFDLYEKRKPYRHTRPCEPVHDNCKKWWRHAIESSLSKIQERNKRASVEFILKRSRDCVSYVDLYYNYLSDDKLPYLHNKLKEDIEAEMDFDTLKTLRQIAVARLKSAGRWRRENAPVQPSTGYLNSWVNWYSGRPADTPPSTDSSNTDHETSSTSSSTSVGSHKSGSDVGSAHSFRLTSTERAALEEEWKDWMGSVEPTESRSTLNKDNVFLHLNFVLGQVNFKLKQHSGHADSQGLVQLECHNIQSSAVIRPRSRSTKFCLRLGGLFIKDLYNRSTQFPVLVSPRMTETSGRKLSGQTTLISKTAMRSSDLDLFYFEIEKNPVRSDKDIRIQMRTQPLDVIYNEGVVRQVQQFFSPRRRAQAMTNELSEFHLAERARRRYEQLKNRTKIDIRDTWDNLLNTSNVKLSKRVGLKLDISAPQLIVPTDLCDSETHMVVFDLGRLKVTNLASQDEEMPEFDLSAGGTKPDMNMDDMADDEDFITPPSTPPDQESDTVIGGVNVLASDSKTEQDLSGDELYTHMYDRYEVLLADIQVLAVSRKDNWRLLTARGISHLHIIDKLSVNVQFERRLLLTADPEWPAIKVSATMESLFIHVSELKLSQLTQCLKKMTARSETPNTPPTDPARKEQTTPDIQPRMVHSQSRLFAPLETRKVLDNSKVVKCDLGIHQMSLDIHRKDTCLVQLQVAGVNAEFTQLPSETDLSLTVHSFIIADALQKYGPDFELLVASHRSVRLDSKSGSMCSSMVMSPVSPRSPRSPRSPSSPEPEYQPGHQSAYRQSSYTSLQNAVISRIQKLLPVATATPMVDHSDVSLRPPSISSADNRPVSPVYLGDPLIRVSYVHRKPENCEESASKFVDVVFNSLDLVANQETIVELLAFLKEVMPKSPTPPSAQDEFDADQASDADVNKPHVESGEEMVVQAEFRKLNVLLHCPDMNKSRPMESHVAITKVAVINMMGARLEAALRGGSMQTAEAELGGLQVADLSPASLHSHVFAFGNMNCDQISHLDQTIPAHMYQTCVGELTALEEKKAFHLSYNKAADSAARDKVVLSIGSIQYIHVPKFLKDLGRSVSLFQEYIEKAKQKLKDAASGVAEYFVNPTNTTLQPELLCEMDIDLTLDAPLLVLPCSSKSTKVLIAELGKMVVTNERDLQDSSESSSATDILNIQIRDMKLVAKEVDPQKVEQFSQEVIIDEAGINLTVAYNQMVEKSGVMTNDAADFHLELSPHDVSPSHCQRAVNLIADVPHALEVSLSRQAFVLVKQAIQTAGSSTPGSQESSTEHAQRSDSKESGSAAKAASSDAMIHVTAAITVPIVSISIKDQLGAAEAQGIVELQLAELCVTFDKTAPHISTLTLQLTSLSALDLLQPENSKHRYLALSIDKSLSHKTMPKFISTSLPGTLVRSRKRKLLLEETTLSLPSSVTDDNIKRRITDSVPATPPSSPREDNSPDHSGTPVKNLVSVTITLVDKDIPGFSTEHSSIDTSVEIDFNSLEMVVNQETWVMVLDFFGLGAKVFTAEQQHEVNTVLKSQPPTEGLRANLSVNSFSLVFVKKCYDLAKASMTGFNMQVVKQQQTTSMTGVLGSLCVDDLSPHGCVHSCKFTTQAAAAKVDSGETSALTFKVFKHDVPDEQLERDFDISVDLEMTSVLYTHTKRFPIEIINFLQDFLEHHDNIGHMRAASSGQQLPSGPGHSARIKLNIRAGTPIIILPGSSLSNEVIVMHLGNLTVSNRFLFAGDIGTLAYEDKDKQSSNQSSSMDYSYDPMTSSLYCAEGQSLDEAVRENEHTCLLDVMSIRLTDMDLYSAKRVAETSHSHPQSDNRDIKLKGYSFTMDQNQPLKERCVLDLAVERNLDNDLSHASPEIAIRGTLSTVYCHLDVQQYKLVRAVLDQNLGEELNDLQRVAKQLPHIQTILSGNVWTVLDMSVDLHNVTIELLHEHKTLTVPAVSLARLDFITSTLAFVSYSNQSKDIDLVSQEIRVTDTRSDGRSVFGHILQPTTIAAEESSTLHMELHLRSSKVKNCASVLFNNMRIFCVADWLVALKDYISSNTEKKLISSVPRVSQAVAPSLVNDAVGTEESSPKLEVKMNLTDTELVLVEDLSSPSSNAIILKTTAVCHYQPTNEQRPIVCNLQKMELFSCCLGAEASTALSIIDPFDVNMEFHKANTVHENVSAHRVEVSMPKLCVRFSYNDLLLFKSILNSLPQQLQSALNNGQQSQHKQTDTGEDERKFAITGVEMSSNLLSLCLINDCADMDVPLFELQLTDFEFNQGLSSPANMSGTSGHVTFEDSTEGALRFNIGVNYYNRLLSGWEPVVEPWQLKASWTGNPTSDDNLNVKVAASEVVNLNMTSALLEMVQQTRELWSSLVERHGSILQPITRTETRRESFVPYSLNNQTGRHLLFAVVTKINGKTSLPTSWTEVAPEETKAFSFMSHQMKQRHQDSHSRANYRLVVMVEGWQKTTPVNIDKVGQFFRTILTDQKGQPCKPKVVSSRVVFDVACMENASKCITVRSPVLLENNTSSKMEARLESSVDQGEFQLMTVPAHTSRPLPLAFLFSQMWFRPAGDEMLTYPDCPITCQDRNLKPGESKSTPLTCISVLGASKTYRLSALVKKEYFPSEAVMETLGEDTLYQPGHTITLLPPLTLVNLLPVELGYLINASAHTGKLKPGKDIALHQVDTSTSMKIDFAAEGYPKGGILHVNSGTSDHLISIRLYDNSDRLLYLDGKITRLALGSVKVTISVKYWMINHTGLPLLFKQVGTKGPSAGQFEEHELARSVAPLMFSFIDREQPELCAMRLGRTVHLDSSPGWSHRFTIDKGNHVRRLRVSPSDGRPEWVYNIGVEVSRGTGRYQETNMIILVPYNKIINKSSHKIAFTQKHLTDKDDAYQASLPGSSQAYHWPRQDLDQLLCVKILDVPDMLWSGGFRINQLNSFVINNRNSQNGDCVLMKIETVLQGSTFTTIIADASDIPPPMRVENYTELSVKYWQTDVNHEEFKTIVKPTSSVSYAWDEPTLPSTITCSIHCDMGASESTYNMNTLGLAEHLEYENYFYILLTDSLDSLVLDVIGGNKIVFSEKEPGRRSQLWSQNVEGRLIHEGTTGSKQLQKHATVKYCLDIADLAVIAEGCSCLALRKVDSRRQTTQIWKFQQDGRLTCGSRTQCVQSLPAFGGSRAGAKVALGPFDDRQPPAFGSKFSMCKMLPGSGVLSVNIDTEGPTRVLKISDIHDLENIKHMKLNSSASLSSTEDVKPSNRQITLAVSVPVIGLSLVNHVREELLYLSLSHVHLKVEQGSDLQTVRLGVRELQIDNQLANTNCPLILYARPPKSRHKSASPSQAIEVHWQRMLGVQSSMNVFKLLTAELSSFSLDIDELLLLKVLEMFKLNTKRSEEVDVSRLQLPRDQEIDVNVRKYYFALLKVACGQLTLSVHTAKLPLNLREVKKAMAMTSLITFENAVIDFEPFQQLHPFESMSFLLTAVATHFKQELQGQAAKIFGSVDVLGNPLGLVNDLTTGISGLVTEGNVGKLLKNVTHGTSNSLAKVAGTLSQGLGWMTMDEQHEESRDIIRRQYTGSNVLLGVRSLGHGVLGGLTSIFHQTYDGATQRGVEGLLTGFGKGVVGTVTKPVVGVLDFASGAATAIRDTSGGGASVRSLSKKRKARCCYGKDGLLPIYSSRSAQGQAVIVFLNGERRVHERYVGHISLSPHDDSYSLLASDQSVYVLKLARPEEDVFLATPLGNLLSCTYVRKEKADGSIQHYLEVKFKQLSESRGSHYRIRNPQFECDSYDIAEQVVLLVDHARSLYDESLHTVSPTNASIE